MEGLSEEAFQGLLSRARQVRNADFALYPRTVAASSQQGRGGQETTQTLTSNENRSGLSEEEQKAKLKAEAERIGKAAMDDVRSDSLWPGMTEYLATVMSEAGVSRPESLGQDASENVRTLATKYVASLNLHQIEELARSLIPLYAGETEEPPAATSTD